MALRMDPVRLLIADDVGIGKTIEASLIVREFLDRGEIRGFTVLCPPPTLLRATGCKDPLAALPELRLLYVGGEALPQELADLWATGRRMVNGYGPTECTVTVTRAEVRPGQPVTIGDAVPGSRAHVLDEDLNDVAFGEWGELCISGASLARGYLGREELTNEKFVEHALHGRIYRTGDRVRRSADGALVYDGRLDAQVKLRGHRVELGEIESRIAAMDGVRAAACTVQAGETLVAFVVSAANGAQPDFDRIRAQLRRDVVGVLAQQRRVRQHRGDAFARSGPAHQVVAHQQAGLAHDGQRRMEEQVQ
jgi:acyl-coenzyme A synthetase/AMP-(fatty) acid ligase